MTQKIITGLIVAIASGIAVIIFVSLVPGIWICDMLSQFRLVYELLLLTLLAICCILKSKVGSIIVLVICLLNTASIAPMFAKRGEEHSTPAKQISVLNYNTEFQHNRNYELFSVLVHEKKPDIIALVEVDDRWLNALKETTKAYPFNKIILAGPGLALYSKYPLRDSSVWYFGKSHHPRISSTVMVGNQNLNLLLIHPTTPQSEAGFEERSRELRVVENEMAAMTSPKILLGDFNDGPWSNSFQRLLDSGLQDSEQGYGPQPSWPARTGRVFANIPIPPLIPIDHVLVSENIKVKMRTTGPSINSDHLPVFVRLEIPTP